MKTLLEKIMPRNNGTSAGVKALALSLLRGKALLLIILALASCSKRNDPVLPQTVTYSVTCKACLVYFEDNTWNRTNHIDGRPDAVSQHLNVYGSWTTTFQSNIDIASLRIYTSVFGEAEQEVHANIHTNDGKVFDRVMFMGADNNDVVMDLPIR